MIWQLLLTDMAVLTLQPLLVLKAEQKEAASWLDHSRALKDLQVVAR